MRVPNGWSSATLSEVAKWGSGGTPKAGTAAYYGGEIPWAVIGDLNDGTVADTRSTITEAGLAASSAKLIPEGALLIAMYGSIGKLGVAGREMSTNQAIAFAVPGARILPRFLFYYLLHQRHTLDAAGKGAAQRNISQTILKAWPIHFPNDLDEQRRIVDILEDHLSRLDAADQALAAGVLRSTAMHKSVLTDLVPEAEAYPPSWRASTVAEAGRVELGRQRHPDWHNGANMRPYLRVANVFEGRIDLRDVKEMHWSGDTFARFSLQPGDVLLNEGQSPEWLGRPAMYRGEPGTFAFTNSPLRFQANGDVLPEFALLVFRRHMHAGRFTREARITTNIAHLSASRLKPIEFPIPLREEQGRLVAYAQQRLEGVARLVRELKAAQVRANALRRSLLEAAFTGRLTGRSSDTDIVEELADA